jgi:drug/metabolite transporter (DMT)-like permease
MTACIIWSSAVLIGNRLAVAFGPLFALALEFLLAGTILSVLAWLRGDIHRIRLTLPRAHLLCGSFWMMNVTLSYLAFWMPASSGELLVTGLVNYLWPAFTLLLSIPILNKRPTIWLFPGLAIVLVGIILAKIAASNEYSATISTIPVFSIAYLLALFDAVAWGLYSNFSRKLSHPNGASGIPLYMLITGGLCLIASSAIEPPHTASAQHWVLLITYASASGAAYFLWDIGMRHGKIVAISTIAMGIPLLSTIITAIFSGHGITGLLLLASGFVVIGSAICRRGVVDR